MHFKRALVIHCDIAIIYWDIVTKGKTLVGRTYFLILRLNLCHRFSIQLIAVCTSRSRRPKQITSVMINIVLHYLGLNKI